MVQLSGTTLSALRAFGLKFQVNANNIANVNTDGFKKKPGRSEGQSKGRGRSGDQPDRHPRFLRPAEDGSSGMIESSNMKWRRNW